MRSGQEQSTRIPIHLYGNAPVGGSRADIHSSQRNTHYDHTTRLRPTPQQSKTHVCNCLPAAGGHIRGSPANSPAAAIAGARAGPPAGHRSPIERRSFRHLNGNPPSTLTTQPSAQGPYRLGRAHTRAKEPVHGRPALHLSPGSAAKIHYFAP